MRRRRFLMVCLAASVSGALAGCQVPRIQAYRAPANPAVTIYVTAAGWHTGIVLPARRLNASWNRLLRGFPGARYLLFGWGQREYYMARHPTVADALRALFPGPAVLLVTPLERPPPDALIGVKVFPVGLTTAGWDRLQAYVRAAFSRSADGEPRRVGSGLARGSVFYAATGSYSANDTCNTWVAKALHAGGLPVMPGGVVFAGQVVDQVRLLAPELTGGEAAEARRPVLRPRPSRIARAGGERG